MLNPSQKMPTFNRGQALPADALNHVVEAVKRMIKEGKGIHIESAGDQIVIHAKGQPMGGGGGGGAQYFYSAASKALLEEYTGVVSVAIGRVTGGADQGVMYCRNPDNTGWNAINRLE